MKNTVKLPQAQQDIIVAALRHYQDGLRNFIDENSDQHLIYTDFDITALTGIFKDSDVVIRVELDKKVHDKFVHRHGVDFPIYN